MSVLTDLTHVVWVVKIFDEQEHLVERYEFDDEEVAIAEASTIVSFHCSKGKHHSAEIVRTIQPRYI